MFASCAKPDIAVKSMKHVKSNNLAFIFFIYGLGFQYIYAEKDVCYLKPLMIFISLAFLSNQCESITEWQYHLFYTLVLHEKIIKRFDALSLAVGSLWRFQHMAVP